MNKAKLPWLLGALLVVACGSASRGVADGGSSGSRSRAADGGTPNAAGSGAASSGSGDDSGYAEASGATDVGNSAGDDGPATGSDASSCMAGASSTASQPGYMGDWSAGDYPSNFSGGNYLTISGVTGQMGNARQYGVHVPTGYSAGTPVPALFCIHGLDQNPVMFCLDSGVAWPTKADQEGFVVIMPNGYMNSWNAGTCCGGAVSAGLDDVALMRAIFAEVGKHVNIDLRRVYATGLSNGGYMSYRLACEASDLFVAVAPSAGAIGTAAIGGGTGTTTDLTTCAPTHKVSVLDIHGTSDPLIPYSHPEAISRDHAGERHVFDDDDAGDRRTQRWRHDVRHLRGLSDVPERRGHRVLDHGRRSLLVRQLGLRDGRRRHRHGLRGQQQQLHEEHGHDMDVLQ